MHAQQQGPRRVNTQNAASRLTCCCGCPVTEEPGLAAWDDLEVQVLRGRWQVLRSAGQESIEVLQPRDLEDRQHYGSR